MHRALLILLTLLPEVALAEPHDGDANDGEAHARSIYNHGIRLWRERDPGAWLVLRGVPPDTEAGQLATRQLERADTHYRRGLEYLRDGDDSRARRAFELGLREGPMDPHHFLDLARVYRDRGPDYRTTEYYSRYLLFLSRAGERPQHEVTEEIDSWTYRAGTTPAEEIEEPTVPVWQYVIPILLALLVGVAVLFFLYRGRTLAELVAERPDLHPRIAYAIGCLRHELLKHRLGALGDTVAALRSGGLTKGQIKYLKDRLFGGESIGRIWSIYLDTFDRLSGRSLNLKRRDREFRRARQAIHTIESLQEQFRDPGRQLADRLDSQRQLIARFDRHLRSLADELCRCRVDGQLLREAVFSVQAESRAGSVRLDEIRFEEPPEDVYVEVFRTDLLIILRNLVRNAIFALDRMDSGRRAVGLEVGIRTEPTGDESVLIKVFDTSPEKVTTEEVYSRRMDHGLGLVAAAVTRYDGSVFVQSKAGDWTKGVAVRFFRVLGENG